MYNQSPNGKKKEKNKPTAYKLYLKRLCYVCRRKSNWPAIDTPIAGNLMRIV